MSNARQLAANLPREGGLSNRNLIINGKLSIWQRGTSFSGGGYHADRFSVDAANSSNFSYSQSTDAPAGFKYSLKIQTTSAFSATSYQFYRYNIEGVDAAQLELGTSSAKTFTLSFWVRASQTGNYSLAFTNANNNYAYPTTYTINTADTWEHKSITVDGATAGTWDIASGTGLRIKWDIGCGSTFDSTTDTWVGADRASVSGTVKLGATLNATLYLTGVQLEVGDSATEFEHEPYSVTLQKAQRYYQYYPYVAEGTPLGIVHGYTFTNAVYKWATKILPVPMRALPSITLESGSGTNLDNKARYVTSGGSHAGQDLSVYGLAAYNEGWDGISGSRNVNGFTSIVMKSYNEQPSTCYGFQAGFAADAEL